MLQIHVYPVMSGIAVRLVGRCTSSHGQLGSCRPVADSAWVSLEDRENLGTPDAVWDALLRLGRETRGWDLAEH